ncbi:MAG: hypothetical protein DWH82_10465 [Planctomycetota bacterium]|nr:MAG: hypothetical protein DWH82_10465 [Planctomycetota bacterium]
MSAGCARYRIAFSRLDQSLGTGRPECLLEIKLNRGADARNQDFALQSSQPCTKFYYQSGPGGRLGGFRGKEVGCPVGGGLVRDAGQGRKSEHGVSAIRKKFRLQ